MKADLTDGVPIEAFWGKLGAGGGAQGYHPLICHMIDVAAVAEAMWEAALSRAAQGAIAVGLGIENPSATRRWVSFLAGAHDLGKCCPAFELREEAKRLWPLYTDLGPRPAGLEARDAPHGAVTSLVLPGLLNQRFGIAMETARRLSVITGGHHGLFPDDPLLQRLEDDPASGRGRWRQARARMLIELAAFWPPPAGPLPVRVDNATAMTLAGLISVADWIGSDAEFFQYVAAADETPTSLDLRAYAHRARESAAKALEKHGWSGWTQSAERRSFAELFPEIMTPRPLQEEAMTLAESGTTGIAVIESPTGEGKTEAALYLADRWGLSPGPRGAYVALPTQATSNQMFGRVRTFLTRRYPADRVNLQLLHGHAALSAEFELLRREGDRLFVPRDVNPEEAGSGVAAAAWFTGGKRGLLAAFGVGTIDQALLAVLQTKHVFVRLFGLSHRTIVIDEVHAYDTYMTTLLERLLEWLGALGAPVVLLSATLPRARRDALLTAYARGLGMAVKGVECEPYPRISWLGPGKAGGSTTIHSHHVAASSRSIRRVALRWLAGSPLDGDEPLRQLGQGLQEALKDGGCAAVICNTVARAQKVFRALQPFFPDGCEADGAPQLDLLHARFLFKDREEREKRTLVRFGKEGEAVAFGDGDIRPVRRPHRAVLVATQIIEQSLDLDFDLMVTDLAPADLVLQRAGRLHRHDRQRPKGLAEPVLWIRSPVEDAGVPRFDTADTYVYDEHVLLRSWIDLRHRIEITVPDDVEDLIEAVYDDGRDPPSDPALSERWNATREALLAARRHDEEGARERRLNHPHAEAPLWKFTGDPRDEDAPDLNSKLQAVTRLAEPSVQVALLYGSSSAPTLDAGGREPVSLTRRPTAAEARELIARSVTLSDRRVVHALLEASPPSGWGRSPLLRNTRLLVLDSAGQAPVGRWLVRLDPEVGVEVVSRDFG